MPNYRFDYKTSSTDASEAGLQGAVYWYDSGTEENSETVYYENSGLYAYWNDGSDWLVSAVGDVGGSPTDCFKAQDYPSTITVAGTGTDLDGTINFSKITNLRPEYQNSPPFGNGQVFFDGAEWVSSVVIAGPATELFTNTSTSTNPPKSGWSVGDKGDPAPTLTYTVPSSDSLLGNGTWTGTVTVSEYTISESWNFAEQTVFDSLADYVDGTQDIDCFRGYLPINEDGQVERVNVWEIKSGNISANYDIAGTYGGSGCWSKAYINAEIHGIFENRTNAMHFAGAVMQWLKENNNLRETSLITECHLADFPQTPEELIVDTEGAKYRYWEVTIPLEIAYLTEGVYSG